MLLDDKELENVSGGKNGKLDLCSLPPGTIKVFNEIYKKEAQHLKRCPLCDAGKNCLEDRYFYFVDTNELFRGQECRSCGNRWVYKILY